LFFNRLSNNKLYFSPYIPTCVLRHLGAASDLLGRTAEAKAFYLGAIDICSHIEFRPELALSRFQLAELLLDHYPNERNKALEHLEFAIGEFREMKMKPSLEKAQELRDRGAAG
jgi:hypothetical protein